MLHSIKPTMEKERKNKLSNESFKELTNEVDHYFKSTGCYN